MDNSNVCDHNFVKEYYGDRCTKCNIFYAEGNAPWDISTEEEEDAIAREEYYANSGTCEGCGGEYGNGWSNCTCNESPGLAKCVGCGCDDYHACHVSKSNDHWEGPCYWIEVDYEKEIGVCSNPECNVPEVQKKYEKLCMGLNK